MNGSCRLNLRTALKEEFYSDQEIASSTSAKFQVNQKLFTFGNFRFSTQQSFLSLDYSATATQLEPMTYFRRYAFSLSGISSQLIAVGGEASGSSLKICEMYSIVRNKWMELPSLNVARRYLGNTVLKSKTAFCFCGHNKEED